MIELGEMRIILIHGFGCSSADWSSQLDSLTRLADVIALDLPGQGDAKHPAGSLIGEMAEAVNDVRRIASLARTVLVGHSMGCRVALEAARRMPKAIVGIVLIERSLRAIGNPDEAVRRHRSHSAEENKVLLKHDFAGMFSNSVGLLPTRSGQSLRMKARWLRKNCSNSRYFGPSWRRRKK